MVIGVITEKAPQILRRFQENDFKADFEEKKLFQKCIAVEVDYFGGDIWNIDQ